MAFRTSAISILWLGTACPLLAQPSHVDAMRGWEWQLTPPLDLSYPVGLYDLDPDHVTARDIQNLKKRRIYSVCYVSVGSWEQWRADAAQFPKSILGQTLNDWPDERYLDVRQLDVVLPLMTERFKRCARMGFDAIEPDNMDAHSNPNGFGLRPGDMLAYMRALADIAHGLGLQIAQKNAPELATRLSPILDFAVTESCLRWRECGAYRSYDLILDAEYQVPKSKRQDYCRRAKQVPGLAVIFKDPDLTKKREDCSNY